MKNLIIILAITIFIVLGCVNNKKNMNNTNVSLVANVSPTSTQQPEVKPIVDIPSFAKKSPEEIEKTLGKPADVVKITKTPEEMPGEFRNYDIPNMSDTLQIRFFKGQAVSFVFTVPKDKQTKTPEELAVLAGIKVNKGKDVSPIATKWEGNFNGVIFEEIKAIKSNNDDYYNLVAKVK